MGQQVSVEERRAIQRVNVDEVRSSGSGSNVCCCQCARNVSKLRSGEARPLTVAFLFIFQTFDFVFYIFLNVLKAN